MSATAITGSQSTAVRVVPELSSLLIERSGIEGALETLMSKWRVEYRTDPFKVQTTAIEKLIIRAKEVDAQIKALTDAKMAKFESGCWAPDECEARVRRYGFFSSFATSVVGSVIVGYSSGNIPVLLTAAAVLALVINATFTCAQLKLNDVKEDRLKFELRVRDAGDTRRDRSSKEMLYACLLALRTYKQHREEGNLTDWVQKYHALSEEQRKLLPPEEGLLPGLIDALPEGAPSRKALNQIKTLKKSKTMGPLKGTVAVSSAANSGDSKVAERTSAAAKPLLNIDPNAEWRRSWKDIERHLKLKQLPRLMVDGHAITEEGQTDTPSPPPSNGSAVPVATISSATLTLPSTATISESSGFAVSPTAAAALERATAAALPTPPPSIAMSLLPLAPPAQLQPTAPASSDGTSGSPKASSTSLAVDDLMFDENAVGEVVTQLTRKQTTDQTAASSVSTAANAKSDA